MLFVQILGYYLGIGLLFSLFFLLRGYYDILADAKGTRFLVRLIWMPAAMLLWPLLLFRLFKKPAAV